VRARIPLLGLAAKPSGMPMKRPQLGARCGGAGNLPCARHPRPPQGGLAAIPAWRRDRAHAGQGQKQKKIPLPFQSKSKAIVALSGKSLQGIHTGGLTIPLGGCPGRRAVATTAIRSFTQQRIKPVATLDTVYSAEGVGTGTVPRREVALAIFPQRESGIRKR